MMKKIVLVFGLFLAAIFAGNFYVNAQTEGMEVVWEAVNISKENANATINGARPGDVVRYELTLSGGAGPGNYNPRIDLADILDKAEVVNLGTGELEVTDLVFPPDLCAGCEDQRFSFFVRVKDICESAESMTITFNGASVMVPFDCDLSDTGPSALLFLSVGLIIVIMGYFILSLRRGKLN